MMVSFLGYVLPWGNMSFWGAMVITNFLRTLPYLGVFLLYSIWGGLNVCEIRVYRFFSLHFILPFVLAVLSIVHLAVLHGRVSRNPLQQNNKDFLRFFPYFNRKDIVGFFVMFGIVMSLLTFFPFIFSDAANFAEASFSETPEHIKPEWYFLPFYAILRAFDTKSSGVLALVFSVVILMFFFLFISQNNFIIKMWLGIVVILGVIGGNAVEEPFISFGKIGTFLYFGILIFFMLF
jgi:ubiquinol-cytochrome c reductase cytochrome b subunit